MALLHRHKMGPVDIITVNADPNGSIPAPIGSFAMSTTGVLYKNTDGATAWTAAGLDFGSSYQSAISDARSTTSLSTFQTKTTLTTPILTGTYRVGWSAIVDQSATNQYVESQLYNVTDAAIISGPDYYQPNNVIERRLVSGAREVSFAGAAKTFQIQYRATGSTAGIAQARIELWRVI